MSIYLVTLTVDRSKFLSPQHAHARATTRVSKTLTEVSPLWFAGIEPQTKTGDGWIHYHAVLLTTQSPSQVRATIAKHWCMVDEHIEADELTGEVSAVRRVRESLGFIDVSPTPPMMRRESAVSYATKYVTKTWPATPTWMLQSTGRIRKLRCSRGVLGVLERLHRHEPSRGRRTSPLTGRRCRARRLVERMASSGTRTDIFRLDQDGQRKYVATVGVAPEDAAATFAGGVTGKVDPHDSSTFGRLRITGNQSMVDALFRMARDPRRAVRREAIIGEGIECLLQQWSIYQQQRTLEEPGPIDESASPS